MVCRFWFYWLSSSCDCQTEAFHYEYVWYHLTPKASFHGMKLNLITLYWPCPWWRWDCVFILICLYFLLIFFGFFVPLLSFFLSIPHLPFFPPFILSVKFHPSVLSFILLGWPVTQGCFHVMNLMTSVMSWLWRSKSVFFLSFLSSPLPSFLPSLLPSSLHSFIHWQSPLFKACFHGYSVVELRHFFKLCLTLCCENLSVF